MPTEMLSDDTGNPSRSPGHDAAVARSAPLLDGLRRAIAASQHDLDRVQRQLTEADAELAWWTSRLTREADTALLVDGVPDAGEFHRLSARLCGRDTAGCRLLHGDPAGREPHAHPVPGPADAGHRSVVGQARLEDPAYRRAAEEARSGHRLRVLPRLATTMQLADGVALFSLRQPTGPAGLLIHHPELVALGVQVFEAAWVDALPLGVRRATGDDQPSGVQLQILRLAAAGAKDDTIARSLGRSTRWVRRHFELLEEELGATNRMTLGIAAVRRGWI
ncbi:hypothetical protein ACH495_02905 [Micromonospora sp. NPDC018662]|uniref:hypothetical protein n=1 Tax=Micromonospora sp. NPDC018662 TaxID=3364238 RepID=UPI0037B122AF